MTSGDISNDLENLLRSAAMNGKWLDVLQIYKNNMELRTAKITAAGDTVLHMAVSSGEEGLVKDVVDLVCGKNDEQDENSPLLPSVDENGDGKKLVLEAKNEKGNTPLHLAVLKGNVEMCKIIVDEDPSLTAITNNDGETPLFMAALFGKREAFLWLSYLYMESQRVSSSDFPSCIKRKKKDNRDTILHCAIEEGHIDVAIEIIHLYKGHLKEMTKMPNKDGLSLLHLLAATPSAFESTDLPRQSFFVQLLYPCFSRVQKKERATTWDELKQHKREPCVFTLKLFHNCFYCLTATLPKIIAYAVAALLFFLLFPAIVLEGLFFSAGQWFHGIRKMKEKHIWSLQIMDELLEHASKEYMPKALVAIEKNALTTAAKNGVIEMVEKILKKFPSTRTFVNDEGKNIVLLAAEKRQIKLYQFLRANEYLDIDAFRQVDKDGNTALHLAAKPGFNLKHQTAYMIQEYGWFDLVKSSVPSKLWEIRNNEGKTAGEVFGDSYEPQTTRDRNWMDQTLGACSLVSTLIASIAFSHLTSNSDDIYSLLALFFSLASAITSFLVILSFRSLSPMLWLYLVHQIAIVLMICSIVSLWVSLVFHVKSSTICRILVIPIGFLSLVPLLIFIRSTWIAIFTNVRAPSRITPSAISYRRSQKKEN